MASIDNSIYDTQADQWWQEGSALDLLHAFNPGRLAYLNSVLENQGLDANTLAVLDVGCGGGFFTETLAKSGMKVSGVDPSEATIKVATQHASDNNLDIVYKTGTGEALPFADNSFDIVTCCDVLEHVSDLNTVIAEITRVLKPGGIFFYDTINRTPLSWAVLIKLAQDTPLIRSVPKNTHVWDMFIKPKELASHLEQYNLQLRDECGLGPRKLMSLVPGFIKYKFGRMTAINLGKTLGIGSTKSKSLLYMGWAVKAA